MRERDRWGNELVREKGRLLKRKRERERERGVREREREKDEVSMRMGKERKVPEKQMCQNCITTTNVNSVCSIKCMFVAALV